MEGEGRFNKRNWQIMLCRYAGETGVFITLVLFSYRWRKMSVTQSRVMGKWGLLILEVLRKQ